MDTGSRRRGLGLIVVMFALLVVWSRWPSPSPPLQPPAPASEALVKPRKHRMQPIHRPAEPDAPVAPTPLPLAPPERASMPQDLVEVAADTGEPGHGLVLVEVYDDDGQRVPMAQVVSMDCEVVSPTGIDGRVALSVPVGTCSFQARRRDGMLFARSEWVEVGVKEDGNRPIHLVLPTERAGGLGVSISAREGGVEVVSVQPGSPAEVMGLMPGDLIVEVDGLPTDTLDLDEFIEVMTGPEGTEVDFVILEPGDTGDGEELTLTRAYITG